MREARVLTGKRFAVVEKLSPTAHRVLGAVEPFPAGGKLGGFACLTRQPGTGDVGPVLFRVERHDEAIDLLDAACEGLVVVFDGSMPGAGKVREECASSVAGLVGKVLGFLQCSMEFFVGDGTCRGNGEGHKGVLLIEKISGLLGEADRFLGVGFRGVRVSPGLAPRENCEGFSFCNDRADIASTLERFFLCCNGVVDLCALCMGPSDIKEVPPGDVGEFVGSGQHVKAGAELILRETGDCIPESDLHAEGALLCRDGRELVLRDVPSCGEAKNGGIVEAEKVACILREERVACGFGEACLGIFESAVAVEPEAVCPAGESRAGRAIGNSAGVDVEGVPEACESEAVRGFDEPVGKPAELGGVGEELGVVGGEVREVGVGGGVAEALEVLLGFVPELSHVCLLSWSDCSPVGGRDICVFWVFVL